MPLSLHAYAGHDAPTACTPCMHNRPRLCGAPQAGLRCSTALLIHPLHARMCPKHRILSANKAATHATASVGMLGMTVVSAGYWPPPYSSACSSQASHAAAGVVERSRLRISAERRRQHRWRRRR